jgi:hypothetical protein
MFSRHPKHARRLTAALIGLGLVLGPAGAAAAQPPYTVSVSVPSTVKLSAPFTVVAAGYSANLSQLTVFHDNQACASTASAESAHPHAVVSVSQQVVNSYSVSRTFTAVSLGSHYFCAYLTSLPPAPLPRAQAFAAYTTVS